MIICQHFTETQLVILYQHVHIFCVSCLEIDFTDNFVNIFNDLWI